jgi:hypothetical protein
MGQYERGGNSSIAAFVNNMMVQLNRTDWPGFSGLSFVGKYGQAECEDLALNTLCLYDSGAGIGGFAPNFYLPGGAERNSTTDEYGNYGSFAMFGPDFAGNNTTSPTTIDGKSRLLEGIGEWPYFSQVSVEFEPIEGTGYVPPSSSIPGSQFSIKVDSSTTSTKYSGYTVVPVTVPPTPPSPNRPAFAGTWPSNGSVTPYNVAIIPSAQIVYPAGFKDPFVFEASNPNNPNTAGSGGFRLVDIAVYATGTYNGAAVTYGSPTQSLTSGHPYYWGDQEDFDGEGMGTAQDTPIGSVVASQPLITVTFPAIYIGPFDAASKPEIQFRCRFVISRITNHTNLVPLEIAPLAYNATPSITATPITTQNTLFQRIMNGTSPSNTAATFLFDTSVDPDFSTWNLVGLGDLNVSYEVTDPRVSHYLTDWTLRSGGINTVPLMVSHPAETKADPISGVIGDSSKFAWPDVGFTYFTSTSGQVYFTGPPTLSLIDLRAGQNASNIQGFPGIGWLSVLPTNIESSQGTVAAGTGSGDPTQLGLPVPWRTLSLEPSTTGQIPDWLLPEAFAIAYDQTFCSQTEGKININTAINPGFPQGTTIPARLKPLEALIQPNTYPSGGNTDLASISASTIATTIAGGMSSASPTGSSGLPSDIYMYPGQLCQLGLNSSGANQWQRESLMRSILSTLTTQSSDFKVYVVAQAVKQVSFTGDPTRDFTITGEQRMNALVSRVTNLGPDNIPDSGWTNTGASFNTASADENDIAPTTATVASSTGISGIGTTLNVTTPTFKYVISDLDYANN